ncbi:unnamed protein product [Cyprideis torosa]|uniref:Uncharacterized protein n=1 Tax=Cyprideis torosa TaxID=163714 RepID=A0A7R8W8Q7_9CRUS|nr:unnamed protein product [Cyprideis torosa]CAG0888851.1 unnamed protein product [Cyprideis torosa]
MAQSRPAESVWSSPGQQNKYGPVPASKISMAQSRPAASVWPSPGQQNQYGPVPANRGSMAHEEYYRTDHQTTQNLAKKEDVCIAEEQKQPTGEHKETTEEQKEPTEEQKQPTEEQKQPTEEERRRTKSPPVKKPAAHTLEEFLKLLNSLGDHRHLHKASQIKESCLKLLSHKSFNIQKQALEFLLNISGPSIKQYRDRLFRLQGDETFRAELPHFSLAVPESGEEGGDGAQRTPSIQPEDRAPVMEIVLRILYGKMIHRSGGVQSAGRSKAPERRNLVLRFLAGCQQEEWMEFFQLSLWGFWDYETNSGPDIHLGEVSVREFPPLKRLQSCFGLLGAIFDQVGNLLAPNVVRCLLHSLLKAAFKVNGALRGEVNPTHLPSLKSLRTMALDRVGHFVRVFESYPWSGSETEALLKSCVWDQMEKLEHEGIHSPTALLKLFGAFSENPRYFLLLGAVHPLSSQTPMKAIAALLSHAKVSPQSSSFVLDIVERLLTTEDFQETSEGPTILRPKISALDAAEEVVSSRGDRLNIGSRLVQTVVSEVTGALGKSLVGHASNSSSVRDLEILSRVAEIVTDPVASASLVQLVIKNLKRNPRPPQRATGGQGDGRSHLILSTKYLLRNVENPVEFFDDMASLFASIGGPILRPVLSDAVREIGELEDTVRAMALLLTNLSAFDPKRPEEPDFKRRLKGFRDARQLLDSLSEGGSNQLVRLCKTLVMVCYYSIANDSDMSLRDASSLCLQHMVRSSLPRADPADCRSLLNSVLMPLLKTGIRSPKEEARHEFITILSVLCSTPCTVGAHRCLADLARLASPDNVDQDFFANITHLQFHRRTRALQMLGQGLTDEDGFVRGFAIETLLGFVLPIAESFLFKQEYAKNNMMVDRAVEVVGGVCLCLSWPRYLLILKKYLLELTRNPDFQKTCIKIIVTVLDAFHFQTDSANPTAPDTDMALPANEEEEEVAEAVDDVDGVEEPDPLPEVPKKVQDAVQKMLLPEIHRVLSAKSSRDSLHKTNRTEGQEKLAEDQEILRIPLILAAVKLLQKLPPQTLETALPGLVLKVCNFLRSRAESVRDVARGTLCKMASSLGPRFLPFLLREMRSVLSKGYQNHVLAFSCHSLLQSLYEQGCLSPGCLSVSLELLVDVLLWKDLFGSQAEERDEKEAADLLGRKAAPTGGRIKEAKGSGHRSILALQILAKFISQDQVLALLTPFKEGIL